MKHIISIAVLLLLISVAVIPLATGADFLSNQKKYERVRTAYKEKENLLKERLKTLNLTLDKLNILFVAYKNEKKLDVFAKSKTNSTYTLLTSYDICASSGQLGPKRMQGDGQVPEGFYHIEKFNPSSAYYLSLGVNYPNLADKKKSTAANLGGDIFIHGECVTIGCMPMTNDKIKEIYLLAIQAYQNGQLKIPVYIFPFKLTDDNLNLFKSSSASHPELITFWENLKKGYDKFSVQFKEIPFTISKEGDYLF